MTDITSLVIEGQDARGRMQEAKRRIKAEVERKYRAIITREIADATVEAEVEFARLLRSLADRGVPQAVLRREVLRTNDWSTWVKWRDLAEIEPERVSARAAKTAKAEAQKPYRVEGGRLWITRNENGPVGEFPALDVVESKNGGVTVWPPMTPEDEGYEAYREAFDKDILRMGRFLEPYGDEILATGVARENPYKEEVE